MQAYSDPRRESDPHALPDVEVFYVSQEESIKNESLHQAGYGDCPSEGWYYWFCFPGCLPDSDPVGPFDTEEEALADAREGVE